MTDDFALRAPGFVQRDNHGRKFVYHYAMDRNTLLNQSAAISAEIEGVDGVFTATLEGKFMITNVGPIQHHAEGFDTQNILGYRVCWRLQIFIGKVIRPPMVSGRPKAWLFAHA